MKVPLLLASLLMGLPSGVDSYAFAPPLPRIIQGGMGVRISSWKLAREVSKKGELGVISGTAMDTILIRTLQDGKSTLAIIRVIDIM